MVKISGVRGAPPRKILRAMDRLFASHSAEDGYKTLERASEGEGYFELAADSPSVEATMGGKTQIHLSVDGLTRPIYVERLTNWKVTVQRIQAPPQHSGGKGGAGPKINASHAGIFGMGACTVFLPLPPYSVSSPFVSLWGTGDRQGHRRGGGGPVWFS